jgi:RNA polymerase-binding transcription factor DksA
MTLDGGNPPAPTDASADEAALASAGAELDAVEAALRRLEDGSFEHCEVCGASLDREQLQLNPLLTRCADHVDSAPQTELERIDRFDDAGPERAREGPPTGSVGTGF